MKSQVRLMKQVFSAAVILAVPAQAINWTGGGGDGLWSTAENWVSNNIPDSNMESAAFVGTNNVSINVDSNFTVKNYLDGYAGEGVTNTLYGSGTLTIDRTESSQPGIQNGTGDGGGVLRLNGNIVVDSSGGLATIVRNDNGSGNVTLFDTDSSLTLNTILQTSKGAGGRIIFNGTLDPSQAYLLLGSGSDHVFLGADHDSSSFGKNFVFQNNCKLTVDGGTVLAANLRFQVNGANGELELNGANALNGPSVLIGSTHDFLIDVNADQDNIGYLQFGGTTTLDLAPAVTQVFFANSSLRAWGDGLVISNFMSGVVRFGANVNGITPEQLALISAYDGTGALVPDLAIDSSGYLTGTVNEIPPQPIGDILIDLINDSADVSITWSSTEGDLYSVYNTPGLTDGSWAVVADNLIGTGGSMSVTDAVDQAQSFYRVYAQ